MIDKNINRGIESLVKESILKFKDNLKAIILFGSGNNTDFILGLSDLDFIYILGYINAAELAKIQLLREKGKLYTDCNVDIKPFSLAEFQAGVKGMSSFEFFTGWGLEMIRRSSQQCLYTTGEVKFDYAISQERIKKDALERAHYYITKLRKIFSSDEQYLLRGDLVNPKGTERLKIIASAVKNVLTFCLAYNGVIVDKSADVIQQGEKLFGSIVDIRKLLEAKNEKRWDNDVALKAYDRVELIYMRAVQNG